MAGFYTPYTTVIRDKSVIVYPCIGIEKVLNRHEKGSLEKHLNSLYASNEKVLNKGAYHIVIIWDEASDDKNAKSVDVMTDVWIFDEIETWGSGPLVDAKIFRNIDLENNIGISAGDGLLMLGREEELRRSSASIKEYLSGIRAKLPDDIEPKENFYLSE